MATANHSVKMTNGLMHPLLGYGTYKVRYSPASQQVSPRLRRPPLRSRTHRDRPQVGAVPASASAQQAVGRGTAEVIADVLAAGYRMFDCAQFYANEAVGKAPPDAIASTPTHDLHVGQPQKREKRE